MFALPKILFSMTIDQNEVGISFSIVKLGSSQIIEHKKTICNLDADFVPLNLTILEFDEDIDVLIVILNNKKRVSRLPRSSRLLHHTKVSILHLIEIIDLCMRLCKI